jgi:hypothetical protein
MYEITNEILAHSQSKHAMRDANSGKALEYLLLRPSQ